jgi:hypothetical protein
MISDESSPAPFDSGTHRRRGEIRLESIANNALLKVLQFALTGIALPAIGFGINTMINRMDSLEAKFIAQDKSSATADLRLLQVEKLANETAAANQSLRERVLSLEFQARIPPQKGTP